MSAELLPEMDVDEIVMTTPLLMACLVSARCVLLCPAVSARHVSPAASYVDRSAFCPLF